MKVKKRRWTALLPLAGVALLAGSLGSLYHVLPLSPRPTWFEGYLTAMMAGACIGTFLLFSGFALRASHSLDRWERESREEEKQEKKQEKTADSTDSTPP